MTSAVTSNCDDSMSWRMRLATADRPQPRDSGSVGDGLLRAFLRLGFVEPLQERS